jgi:polyisoprenoid-binding protein YceI
MRHLLAVPAVLAVLVASASAAVYEIDASHSTVGFKIRHVVTKTSGRFTKFSGVINHEPGKPQAWSVQAEIDPASINTDNEKRDGHLRSPDFFDTAKFPKMSFKSVKVTDAKGDSAKLHGELTMHGVTKPVVLDLEFTGAGKDPWGNEKAGFSAKGKLNRKDFGIVWNKTVDNGGFILGDEVEVVLEIEADAKKPAAKK